MHRSLVVVAGPELQVPPQAYANVRNCVTFWHKCRLF